MTLNSTNCSYPPFWGKEIKWTGKGWTIQNPALEVPIQIPNEFDFFMHYCGKDPLQAKEYFKL